MDCILEDNYSSFKKQFLLKYLRDLQSLKSFVHLNNSNMGGNDAMASKT